jgi:hypothetical protein
MNWKPTGNCFLTTYHSSVMVHSMFVIFKRIMRFLPMVPMGVLVHPAHHGSVNPKEFELGEMVNYTRDRKIW